jgi:hypothetical protein
MILTTSDGNKVRLYAGLYMRTKKRTRFWGWGSWGSKIWGSAHAAESAVAEAERPWAALAEWLRLAHARLDRNTPEEPIPAKPGSQNYLSE